jgi:hypothetical protein
MQPRDRVVKHVIFDTNSYVPPRVQPPPHSKRRGNLPFHVEMSSLFLHGEPHALGMPRRYTIDGSIILRPIRSALDTRPLRANTPSSLQSQGDPSTGVDWRICHPRRPMLMVHRVSTSNKHRVNRLYVHQNYGVETKEPTTSAAVPSTGWIAMAAEKAWGIGMKRASCVSRRSHQGAEGKVLPWRLNTWWTLVKERSTSTWSHSAFQSVSTQNATINHHKGREF